MVGYLQLYIRLSDLVILTETEGELQIIATPAPNVPFSLSGIGEFILPRMVVVPITAARGLRHEPSSPARTLGSWVRIPLKAWMSVCRLRPYDGMIPRTRSPTDCVQIKKL
jgi:hypothetical protein